MIRYVTDVLGKFIYLENTKYGILCKSTESFVALKKYFVTDIHDRV